jgi:hypothetical protein
VGVTAGSREVPGRKPVTRENNGNNNSNNNNNNVVQFSCTSVQISWFFLHPLYNCRRTLIRESTLIIQYHISLHILSECIGVLHDVSNKRQLFP